MARAEEPAAHRPPAVRRALPRIGPRCTGCGRCVPVCEPHILWLEPQGWTKAAVLHEAERCTGCALCAVVCPFGAIRMSRER